MSIETLLSETKLALTETTSAIKALTAAVEASNAGREQALAKIGAATGVTEKAAETVAKALTKTEEEAPKATRTRATKAKEEPKPEPEPEETEAPLVELTDMQFREAVHKFINSGKSADEAEERKTFMRAIMDHAGGSGKIFERITDNAQRHATLKIIELYAAGKRFKTIEAWYSAADSTDAGASNSDEDDIA